MKILFYLLIAFLTSIALAADDLSYGQLKEKYINQSVRIGGMVSGEKLIEWNQVLSGAGPKYTQRDSVDKKYLFASGKVISIELVEKPVILVDVFGKEIDLSLIKNPYVDVIVQFDDGSEIATRGFARSLVTGKLQLLTDVDAKRHEIQDLLSHFPGKFVFLPMYQKVYATSVPLEDFMRLIPESSPLSFNIVPRATPLKIIDAKYFDGYNRVLIKIALPDGQEGIMVGNTELFYLKRNYRPSDFDRLGFYAELSLKQFTTKEIMAIKKVEFFTGMSKKALYWSVGLSDKKNDYGNGGEQLIFPTGLIVYLKNDRVTGYQRLAK